MRQFTLAAVCLPVTIMMFTAPAYAQCPVSLIGNPLAALTGTWGFKLQGFSATTSSSGGGRPASSFRTEPGFSSSTTSNAFVAIIGNFTASNGTTSRSPTIPQGALTVTETLNLNGGVNSGTSGGSFTINFDCSGGTLNLGSGTTGLDSYQFIFVNGFTQMYLLSTDSSFTIVGEAKLVP
jgi:hypothetical protein